MALLTRGFRAEEDFLPSDAPHRQSIFVPPDRFESTRGQSPPQFIIGTHVYVEDGTGTSSTCPRLPSGENAHDIASGVVFPFINATTVTAKGDVYTFRLNSNGDTANGVATVRAGVLVEASFESESAARIKMGMSALHEQIRFFDVGSPPKVEPPPSTGCAG